MEQDLLLIGAGRQRQRRQAKTEKADKDREGKKTEKAGKDREGKKTEKVKTEKADKDREGKKDRRVYSEMFVSYNGRRAVTIQRISQEYIKSALWIVTVPVSVQPC